MPRLNQKALAKHRSRFLRFFPKAFRDERYLDWEHDYKWAAHTLWNESLSQKELERLINRGDFLEVGRRALQVESGTTFLFSFEKMALRDAIRTTGGAETFAEGIYNFLHGSDPLKDRFIQWIVDVSELPRRQSRVLSWPILTLFPYLAQPKKYMIMKPTAMRVAADALGFDLQYSSKPNYGTYQKLLEFGDLTKEAIADLKPRNYHDVQTFLWVIGSAEYERLQEELGF